MRRECRCTEICAAVKKRTDTRINKDSTCKERERERYLERSGKKWEGGKDGVGKARGLELRRQTKTGIVTTAQTLDRRKLQTDQDNSRADEMCSNMHIDKHKHIHMHLHIHVYVHADAHVRVHTHIHIHIHMHIHIHIHIHVYICISKQINVR